MVWFLGRDDLQCGRSLRAYCRWLVLWGADGGLSFLGSGAEDSEAALTPGVRGGAHVILWILEDARPELEWTRICST